jgi:hypothetical protein
VADELMRLTCPGEGAKRIEMQNIPQSKRVKSASGSTACGSTEGACLLQAVYLSKVDLPCDCVKLTSHVPKKSEGGQKCL